MQYRPIWGLVMFVGTLFVSTSGKLLVRQCSDGCSIVSQVLTCTQLDEEDFPKLSQCIRKHHGALVVNIRKTNLACSCQFLDFVKMLHETPRKIIFYDTVCSSKLIVQCGASKGVVTVSVHPIFSLIGGKVFDVTGPDFESKLTNMDNQQTNVIDRLHKTSTRKQYSIAQEQVIEQALVDRSSHFDTASENKHPATGDPSDDEDTEDVKDNTTDKILGEGPDEYQYSTLEKLFFIFLILHVSLFAILIAVLIRQDLYKSLHKGEEDCASNNAIESGSHSSTKLMNNVEQ